MPEACPKSLASPTLYSLLQFRLRAAFQPHYAAGLPQLEDATGTGRVPGVGEGVRWSQRIPPGTAWGQGSPCRWPRLPEGSDDAEGACSFPGCPSGSWSRRTPGHRQQVGHDRVAAAGSWGDLAGGCVGAAHSPSNDGEADANSCSPKKKQRQRAKSGTALHLEDRGLGTFDHMRAQVLPQIPMPPKSSTAAS